MAAQLIDGKAVSAATRAALSEEIAAFRETTGVTPALAVVLVGSDPASAVYVRNKHKACLAVGIRSEEYTLPETATEEELLSLVQKLNEDDGIHGILVQLPLPKQICEEHVLRAISPLKDVDAFHPENVGRIVAGKPRFLPCTPAGVVELLSYYKIPTDGKECVIVGRSNIVGKPLFHLMLGANATVTVCHSHTKNLAEITRRADILIAAIGRARFIGAEMVKAGAVVVDVGINRLPDGKLCGDVDFDAVAEKASYITPVPGGVGVMTVTELLKSTLTAAKIAVYGEESV